MNVHVHVSYYYDTGEVNDVESGLVVVVVIFLVVLDCSCSSSSSSMICCYCQKE